MNMFSSLTNSSTTDVGESDTPQSINSSSSRDPKRKRRYKNTLGYKRKQGKQKRRNDQLSLMPCPSLGVPPPQPLPETPPSQSYSQTLSPITLSPLSPSQSLPPHSPSQEPYSQTEPPSLYPLESTALTTIAYGPKGMRMTVKQSEAMRITIDTIFRQKYAKTYTREKLNGTDGVIQSICRDINYFQPTTVRRVVLQSYIDIQNENDYDARKKKFVLESRRKIQNGTYEHHLLTVLKEGNNSFLQCTEALNSLHCATKEIPAMGLTAIYNAVNLCNFEKLKTKKIMQTNIKNLT